MTSIFCRTVVVAGLIAIVGSSQAGTVNLGNPTFAYVPPDVLTVTIGISNQPTFPTMTFTGETPGLIEGTYTNDPGYGFIPGFLPSGRQATFCVELYQNILGGTSASGYSHVDPLSGYNATTAGANGWGSNAVGISGQIDKLMAIALAGGVLDGTTAEAMQLLIWDVIYDYSALPLSSSSYSLASGNFQVSSATPVASAVSTAFGNFVTALAGAPTASQHYLVAKNDNLQDMLVVPEPSSIALVGLALTGLAIARRRRST